jgi:hypothetical protein
MSRNIALLILASLTLGSVAALISGLYTQDLSYGLGVSVTGYGLPLSWVRKSTTIYPGEPTRYEFCLQSLLLDISFWSLIIGVSITVLSNFLKQKSS